MDAWYLVAAERLERVDHGVPDGPEGERVVVQPVLRQRPVGPVHAVDRETGRALCGYTGTLHALPKAWGEVRWDRATVTPCATCRERYSSPGTV